MTNLINIFRLFNSDSTPNKDDYLNVSPETLSETRYDYNDLDYTADYNSYSGAGFNHWNQILETKKHESASIYKACHSDIMLKFILMDTARFVSTSGINDNLLSPLLFTGDHTLHMMGIMTPDL